MVRVDSLNVSAGETLVIVGPNGSGKSSLLLSLALLLKPAGGTLCYAGSRVTSSRTALALRRQFAVVFQDPLLLQTTVMENVTLGLRLRGVGRAEARARAQVWLDRFGIGHLAGRQAKTISGGEAQRASLARAFVLSPQLLFLDEPFSALDAPSRQSLIEDVHQVLKQTRVSTIIVTHDRNEALTLADRVAVLIGGEIRQLGTPSEVFSAPVDESVASFVGVENILPGNVVSSGEGIVSIAVSGIQVDGISSLEAGEAVTVCLRPEDITLALPSLEPVTSSARNRLKGKVARIVAHGSQVRVTVDCGFDLVALITRRSCEEMGLVTGKDIVATFKASSLHLIKRH